MINFDSVPPEALAERVRKAAKAKVPPDEIFSAVTAPNANQDTPMHTVARFGQLPEMVAALREAEVNAANLLKACTVKNGVDSTPLEFSNRHDEAHSGTATTARTLNELRRAGVIEQSLHSTWQANHLSYSLPKPAAADRVVVAANTNSVVSGPAGVTPAPEKLPE